MSPGLPHAYFVATDIIHFLTTSWHSRWKYCYINLHILNMLQILGMIVNSYMNLKVLQSISKSVYHDHKNVAKISGNILNQFNDLTEFFCEHSKC